MDNQATDYFKEKVRAGKFPLGHAPANLGVQVVSIDPPHVTLAFDLIEEGSEKVIIHIGRVVLQQESYAIFQNSDGGALVKWPLSLDRPAAHIEFEPTAARELTQIINKSRHQPEAPVGAPLPVEPPEDENHMVFTDETTLE